MVVLVYLIAFGVSWLLVSGCRRATEWILEWFGI